MWSEAFSVMPAVLIEGCYGGEVQITDVECGWFCGLWVGGMQVVLFVEVFEGCCELGAGFVCKSCTDWLRLSQKDQVLSF